MEIKGIDVSSHQGNINWKTVSNYGIDFSILRITDKSNNVDATFEKNYSGCILNNIPVGVYKYSYAKDINQSLIEADNVLKVLNGRKLDFPVFLDLEFSEQKILNSSTIENIALAFLNRISEKKYTVGIYCNLDWYKNVLTKTLKKYDCWIASYPFNDNGTIQEALRPSFGVGWQYSSKAKIPGINGNVDRSLFYKNYAQDKNIIVGGNNMSKNIVQNVIDDAVGFAVKIANDNTHGYSQSTRSLYNIENPKSFDCSSLVLTAFYYSFKKNGLNSQANYLKQNCSYTGNMLKLLNVGFEIVVKNQTSHTQMKKGDIELNTTYHTALAIDNNNIVHARSSEGTSDTYDNSGNEIRTQSWYLYSHGWTHRLRFTGKGLNISNMNVEDSSQLTLNNGATTVSTEKKTYNKTKKHLGVVTADSLNVRQNAGTSYAKCSFSPLKKGTKVYVCDSVKDSAGTTWLYIKYQSKYGFVSGKYIENQSVKKTTTTAKTTTAKSTTTTSSTWVGEVTASSLNVRTGAGTSKSILSAYPKLSEGNKITVLSEVKASDGSKWYKISINNSATGNKDVIGYVSANYIKKA